MFELLKAATGLPPLLCTSPDFFAFIAEARNGAYGYTALCLSSPRDARLDNLLFINRNKVSNLK